MKRYKLYSTVLLSNILLILCSCDASLSRDSYSSESSISTGGSLASFAISDDKLFTINDGALVSYDISQPETSISMVTSPIEDELGYTLYGLETIFPYGDYLFLGASDGMHIIDIENVAFPNYVSGYEHVVSCDPVVVQDSYAYVTLRGGNVCGQSLSQLQVIDISDVQNLEIVETYDMSSPYGLGVDGDILYVCDNDLVKVFDISNPRQLEMISSIEVYSARDIILQDNLVIILTDSSIEEYVFEESRLKFLSSLTTN